MPHLVVGRETLLAIAEFSETGMDYTVVDGECVQFQIYGPFVVRSNGVTMPYRSPRHAFYDFEDLIAGKQFPDEHRSVELKNIEQIDNAALLYHFLHYPPGFVPTRGAHPLLASTTLSHDTKFIRYTSTLADPRYASGTLSAGTYMTSFNDSRFVNTGFGTVGRYALPIPVPAKHIHEYTIPKGTVLQVGTVAPNWGQAGGGVEVCTTAPTSIPFVNNPPDLDDY